MEYVQRYTLDPNKDGDFRSWLVANEQRLRNESPDTWTYLGTFFVVHNTADYACETRWKLDSYSALEATEGGTAWQELIGEFGSFISDLPPGRTVLMKDAADVMIIQSEES